MTRERDKHPRPRGDRKGRLPGAELVRLDLQHAADECRLALGAESIAAAREHVTLAGKFVAQASERLQRLRG